MHFFKFSIYTRLTAYEWFFTKLLLSPDVLNKFLSHDCKPQINHTLIEIPLNVSPIIFQVSLKIDMVNF